eukprot:g33.t1
MSERKSHRRDREDRTLSQAQEIKDLREESRCAIWKDPNTRRVCHWENLLEEMKWMATDFQREMKWKLKEAKIYARRCVRIVKEAEIRELHKDIDEESRKRKECNKIAKEIQHFWRKSTKVVHFKIQQKIELQKRLMLDKHLAFLVGQTERYSNLLAQNLSCQPPTQQDEMYSEDQHDEEVFEHEVKDQMESKDVQEELEALDEEATLSLEELMRRYGLTVGDDCVIQCTGCIDSIEKNPKRRRIGDDSTAPRSVKLKTSETTSSSVKTTEVPFLLKHELREYQRIGLNWLVTLYQKRINGILADEMGLGKTIQTIALLAWLACDQGSWGPHLIVVPTSVMLNWEMEFKKWCPAFKLLTYYGSAKERKQKRQGWSKPNAFHICITSYAICLQDSIIFKRKKWNYLILDEAHMIKNWKSQRWQTLLKFNSSRRLLLTGTPLQNDLMELWSLMHFLMPHVFSSHERFRNWFSTPLNELSTNRGPGLDPSSSSTQEVIPRLHAVLRPFLLRRLKSEVERQLPQKHEHVVYCDLSRRQKKLYEEYITSGETQSTLSSRNFMGIINVLMQLRKVCNHPDLFEGRQILSPLDLDPIEIHFPSLLSPNPTNAMLLPYGLGDLISQGAPSWEGGEIRRLEVEDDQLRDVLLSRELEWLRVQQQEIRSMMKGQDTMDAVLEALQNLHRKHMNEKLQQIEFIQNTNSIRCQNDTFMKLPLMLYNMIPLRATGLIKSYSMRARECSELISSFSCYIPKARSPPVVSWCCYPDSSTVQKALALVQMRREQYQHQAEFLWPSISRSRMSFPDRYLVQFDCGKLQTLARLLHKLRIENHRVLIFTQMSKVLDILEEFLNIHGYRYLRLDGSTKAESRQGLMQRFNQDSRIFVFILSTRSGGVGVNLTGADTVIFYDSDWNPAMDKQAQDRCHRIGQTREVNIYRLVTRYTIEENILKKSEEKRHLDFLAIQSGEFNLQFLQKLSPSELINGASNVGLSPEDVQTAMRNAEDESDAEAAQVVEQETAAELAEFSQDDSDDEIEIEQQSKELSSKSEDDQEEEEDEQMEVLLEACTPIEKYAIRLIEEMSPPVDIEQSANVLLDGLNETEWHLEKLEAVKEQQEDEVHKEEFRISDWDKTQAKMLYSDNVEAVEMQVAAETERLMEAERRKHDEYMRILNEQQSQFPTKRPNEETQEMNSIDVKSRSILWKKMQLPNREKIKSLWDSQLDFLMVFLAEAVGAGMCLTSLVPFDEEVPLPDGVWRTIAIILRKLIVNTRNKGSTMCFSAEDCKERFQQLIAGSMNSGTKTNLELYEFFANAQQDLTLDPSLEQEVTEIESLFSRMESWKYETDFTEAKLSVAVSKIAAIRDNIAMHLGIEVESSLFPSLQQSLASASTECQSEERCFLSMITKGSEQLIPQLRPAQPTRAPVRITQELRHRRSPLQPGQRPRPVQHGDHMASGTGAPAGTQETGLSRVFASSQVLVHPQGLQMYLNRPPEAASASMNGQVRSRTFIYPLSWTPNLMPQSTGAASVNPTVALGVNRGLRHPKSLECPPSLSQKKPKDQ